MEIFFKNRELNRNCREKKIYIYGEHLRDKDNQIESEEERVSEHKEILFSLDNTQGENIKK